MGLEMPSPACPSADPPAASPAPCMQTQSAISPHVPSNVSDVSAIPDVSTTSDVSAISGVSDVKAQLVSLYVELAQCLQTCAEYLRASNALHAARRLLRIHLLFAGVLGKRMRAQTTDTPLLVVQVATEDEAIHNGTSGLEDTAHPAKGGAKLPGMGGGKSPGEDGAKSPSEYGAKSPGEEGGKSPADGGVKLPGGEGGKSPPDGGVKLPGGEGGNSVGDGGEGEAVDTATRVTPGRMDIDALLQVAAEGLSDAPCVHRDGSAACTHTRDAPAANLEHCARLVSCLRRSVLLRADVHYASLVDTSSAPKVYILSCSHPFHP